MGFVLRVGSSFLLNPTLNTSPELDLQYMLSCRHTCPTLDSLGKRWGNFGRNEIGFG